jgi:hypothetical protein
VKISYLSEQEELKLSQLSQLSEKVGKKSLTKVIQVNKMILVK